MNKTTLRGYALIPLILAFFAGVVYLVFLFFINGSSWSSNKANAHIYTSGRISSAGTIYDSAGKALAKSVDGERVFNDSRSVRKATLHIVGDPAGVISTGAHNVFKSKLSGYSFISGIYPLLRHGGGNDIVLAVNADACVKGLEALGGHNGAVGVLNYKTGALMCCVSSPTYDIKNPPSDINDSSKYEGIYLNRLFSGVYTPGSIFKIVTAISALENIPDIESKSFTCPGEMEMNGGKLVCMKSHGKISFDEALGKSCNCAFAKIAMQLGAEKLNATAKSLGFNTPLKADGVKLAISSFDVSGTNNLNLSWAGIGQYTTLVNPCHMLMIAGAIANGGQGVSPYIAEKITNGWGVTVYKSISKNSAISIDPAVAVKLKSLLRSNVKNQYGESRFPGLSMCGKTGTAEIDGKSPHSWFVGFSLREDLPLAVIVIAENAGSGSGVAMSAANAVLQSLAK